jgi:hypothetical protein
MLYVQYISKLSSAGYFRDKVRALKAPPFERYRPSECQDPAFCTSLDTPIVLMAYQPQQIDVVSGEQYRYALANFVRGHD